MEKQTLTIQINGMHCTSCAMNIDFELEDIAGIQKVNTNYAKQKSIVQFNPKLVSDKKIIATINKLGYTTTILKLE